MITKEEEMIRLGEDVFNVLVKATSKLDIDVFVEVEVE